MDKWNTTDENIAQYANQNNLTLITKDQDFRNSFLLKRTPKKLIKVNLGNIPNNELMSIFEQQIEAIRTIDDQNERYMVELGQDNFWILTK